MSTMADGTQYLVGTIRKTDDVLFTAHDTENGKRYLTHAVNVIYSDCARNCDYLMIDRVSNIRPATQWDFEFFKVCPPRRLMLEAGQATRGHWLEDDLIANPPTATPPPPALLNLDWVNATLNSRLGCVRTTGF